MSTPRNAISRVLEAPWLCDVFVADGRGPALFQITKAKASSLVNADRIVAATFDVPSLVDWDNRLSAIAGCEYSGV
jgi:hypothetical protein